MKKLFTFILLSVCTSLLSNAQFIGLRGGFGLASISSSLYSSYYPKSRPILGFQGCVIAEFPLSSTSKWLTMETGLMIQTKGSNLTYSTIYPGSLFHPSASLYSNNILTNLYYLDIPLSVKMYSSVGKTSLYFEVGPYVGIGLSGKLHDPQIRTISWGSSLNKDNYKRFDSGISMGVGLKIKPFLIGLSYDLGLANIFPEGGTDYYAHNRFFSVFAEFMILRKDESIKQQMSPMSNF